MEDKDNKLKKKHYEYQQCKKEIWHLKEGINTTEDVWNKYVKHIEDLIAIGKIKDQAVLTIQTRIMVLNKHWQDFKAAWGFKLSKSNANDHDPFDPNPYQQYSIDKLLPRSTQKQELDCFAKKFTELHHLVKELAYPCWFDRLYQFIKTTLLKLYNSLYTGPGNRSGESTYINVTPYGCTSTLSQAIPTRHNYFICQEKLRHNTAVLKNDLSRIEHWQKLSV